jgi:hypothetical protein
MEHWLGYLGGFQFGAVIMNAGGTFANEQIFV